MNRHQLQACISAELQTAMKDYTHDDLPRTVTDTAAHDVLSALREGLRITTIQQLDALPQGAVIRCADRRIREKFADGHWYATGSNCMYGSHLRQCMLDAHLIWHPAWITKGMR